MTLEQLRIFVAVAERQHVTEAAHALNVARRSAPHPPDCLKRAPAPFSFFRTSQPDFGVGLPKVNVN